MVMVVVSLEKYGKVKKKYTPFLQCYSEDCWHNDHGLLRLCGKECCYRVVSNHPSSTLGSNALIISRNLQPIFGLYCEQITVKTPYGRGIHSDV